MAGTAAIPDMRLELVPLPLSDVDRVEAMLAERRGAGDTPEVAPPEDFYYRRDLALIHHCGFGFRARACAPGIVALPAGLHVLIGQRAA